LPKGGNSLSVPSIDDWIKEMYIYTMEYYLTIRKSEILSSATKWMELDIIFYVK
jgi:hypothetical protein